MAPTFGRFAKFLRWLLTPFAYDQCKAEVCEIKGRLWAYCVRGKGHPGSHRKLNGESFD